MDKLHRQKIIDDIRPSILKFRNSNNKSKDRKAFLLSFHKYITMVLPEMYRGIALSKFNAYIQNHPDLEILDTIYNPKLNQSQIEHVITSIFE